MSYSDFTDLLELYFTTGVRWVFVGLTALLLLHQLVSLIRMRNPSEIWAYLRCPDGSSVPLTHWENLIGRGRGCDIILNLTSVSRSHATLIRDSDGVWRYHDLNSKNGSYINGVRVYEPTVLKGGDQLTIGGEDFELYPVSLQERLANVERRRQRTHPVSPWPSLVLLTIFQLLTVYQFHISLAEQFSVQIIIAFGLLCALMWAYVIVLRGFRRNSFEMEVIAFYLSTLSLAVTTSAYPDSVLKQSICVLLGVILFFAMCVYLRDLKRTKQIMYLLIGCSVVLLLLNLFLGTVVNGSQNWISIAGFTFQPSELVKIVFIFVGAATLDELQDRRNLLIFMAFSVYCLGCLALMGDFGTAIIFFVTFLVISFLRSGDFTKLFLVLGAAGLMGLMVLRFRPYVADRFDTWGHVWDDPTGDGFQQVQTMTSIASGGLPGLGAGEGNLSDVAAASTDLVFGLVGEEWGLIIAVLSVLCIITLGVFAFRSITAGRSTYYSIAACATTALFMFQTILNVFGSLDLLPLTGVTFPFLSSGGTSMIASWGMLAFLKAADTRQNASFAIRLDRKSEFKDQLSDGGLRDPQDLFSSIDSLESMSSSDIAEQMEKDEEFQRFWKEQQEEARREVARQDAAKRKRSPKPVKKQASSAQQTARSADPSRSQTAQRGQANGARGQAGGQRSTAGNTRVQPRTGLAPEDQVLPGRPVSQPGRQPARRKPAKQPPKSQSYRNVDDDAFFRSFDEAARKWSGQAPQDANKNGNQPLTLEDIFNDDFLGGDDR